MAICSLAMDFAYMIFIFSVIIFRYQKVIQELDGTKFNNLTISSFLFGFPLIYYVHVVRTVSEYFGSNFTVIS